jgi:D-alanyl-lipoteichoic acid acyltransferase DltB (MBOAT superfamily)
MLFNSLSFLVFFVLFFVVYFALRGTGRTVFLLAASYVFYGWWDWRFLVLIVFTSTMDYTMARKLENCASPGKRKRFLLTSIVSNLSILGFFKYFNFFVDSFKDAASAVGLDVSTPALEIILPVGISFYTFQSLGCVIDVYRGRTAAGRSWLRYASYVAFFPQLVAGPIERAAHLLPQFSREHALDAQRFVSGFQLALLGFVKKVVVADSLSALVDLRFSSPLAHSPLDLWLGMYFFALQLYCDFSGYSDIAVGTARILGFDLRRNFDRPYFAGSFREFWQRWHVSLSSWFRDYVYIPLGGNRLGGFRTFQNLMLTMLVGGLWHGAKWTFVFWGLLNGVYIAVERLVGDSLRGLARALGVPGPVRLLLARAVVFHGFCASLILFRAPSFHDAAVYLGGMAALGAPAAFQVMHAVLTAKALVLCAGVLVLEAVSFRFDFESFLDRHPGARLLALALGIWALMFLGNFAGQRFIYFQF